MAYKQNAAKNNANLNEMNIPQLTAAYDYYKAKMDKLNPKNPAHKKVYKQYDEMLTRIMKARTKLSKLLRANTLGYTKETATLRLLNGAVENGEIDEIKAKTAEGTWGQFFKMIAGVTLSVTGIGLLAAIPIFKSAWAKHKIQKQRIRLAQEENFAQDEQIQNQNDADSMNADKVHTHQDFTDKEIEYLMDHPGKLRDLEAMVNDPATPTSTKAFLRKQINAVNKKMAEGKKIINENKVAELLSDIAQEYDDVMRLITGPRGSSLSATQKKIFTQYLDCVTFDDLTKITEPTVMTDPVNGVEKMLDNKMSTTTEKMQIDAINTQIKSTLHSWNTSNSSRADWTPVNENAFNNYNKHDPTVLANIEAGVTATTSISPANQGIMLNDIRQKVQIQREPLAEAYINKRESFRHEVTNDKITNEISSTSTEIENSLQHIRAARANLTALGMSAADMKSKIQTELTSSGHAMI
ncbi:MAG: hypothetical protein IJ538_00710 [Clostridia bacterium]|nr:hypothetical protein [Clostridia bacterium]